nr:hypothetical protein [Acidovorax sp. 1608163]
MAEPIQTVMRRFGVQGATKSSRK